MANSKSYPFDETRNALREISIATFNKTTDEIGELFGIVDEEPITFTLILSFKRLIEGKREALKLAIEKDISHCIKQLNHQSYVSSSSCNDYVENNVLIDIVVHNKNFEGKTSGSDFGLVYEIPEMYGNHKIRPVYHGLLIQAKRNALKIKNKINLNKFHTLSKNFGHFSKVRKFLSIVLYNFETDSEKTHLTKIEFLDPGKLRKVKSFEDHVDKMLKGKTNGNTISVDKFISLVFKKNNPHVTRSKAKIEKYIYNSSLPCIEIKIRFKDDEKALGQFIRQISDAEQKLKEYVKI